MSEETEAKKSNSEQRYNLRLWAMLGSVIVFAIAATVIGIAWHEYMQNESFKTCLRTHVEALECKASRP